VSMQFESLAARIFIVGYINVVAQERICRTWI